MMDFKIYKIQCCGIKGEPVRLIQRFLKSKYQRVILNGQTSGWLSILVGVPQGSILGPLFFLIYINDLTKDLLSKTKLFADDTNESADRLNKDLQKKIHKLWCPQYLSGPIFRAK